MERRWWLSLNQINIVISCAPFQTSARDRITIISLYTIVLFGEPPTSYEVLDHLSMTDCKERSLFSRMPIVWTQLILHSFIALCRWAWYFGAPKYPKRFVNPAMRLCTISCASKKQRHFVLCSIFFKIKLSVMNTKPLRFRFVSAVFTVVHLFF